MVETSLASFERWQRQVYDRHDGRPVVWVGRNLGSRGAVGFNVELLGLKCLRASKRAFTAPHARYV